MLPFAVVLTSESSCGIDTNELNVRVTRGKTNEDLLNDIEDALEVAKDGDNNEDDNTPSDTKPEDTPSAPEPEEEPDPEPAPAPTHSVRRRGEHNDDTNEPAVNPVRERRAARPERRRR